MVIFFLFSGESCGGGHGISSREEAVGASSPKEEGVMTMVIFSLSRVERAVEVGMASSREEEVRSSYS